MMFRLFLFCAFCSAFIHCDDLPDGVKKMKTLDEIMRERKGDAEQQGENDGEMFEGDISTSQGSEEGSDRNMINGDEYRWPKDNNGIVKLPYVIDSNAKLSDSEKANLLAAVKDYRQWTCIDIVPRTNEEDYVKIIRGTGCWSKLGRLGIGEQELSLGNRCAIDVGTPTHELMHALGFNHEQTRTDRDKYVTIVWDKVIPKYKFAFDICAEPKCKLPDFPYDMQSVMQYEKYGFSIDGSDTIVAKNEGEKFGQRIGLSNLDIRKLDQMYKCNGNTVEPNDGVRPLERKRDIMKECEAWSKTCADPNEDYKTYRMCAVTCKDMVKGSNFDIYNECDSHKSRCAEDWFTQNCALTCGHPRPTNRD